MCAAEATNRCVDQKLEFEHALQQFRALLNDSQIDAMQPLGPATVYTALMTIWLLVFQRIHAGRTLTDAVSEFLQSDPASLPNNRRVRERSLSSNTGAYSRARTRLKLEVTERVAKHVYESLVSAMPPSLGDRRVFTLDGTTVTLAPTKALRAIYPPASNQHGESVWPVAQMLVAHELESGCAILPEVGAMYGNEAVGEVELAQRLLPRLPERSVLMADRNFGVFAFAYAATQAGHDMVLRMTQSRFESLERHATPLHLDGMHRRWELNWRPSAKERKLHPELPEIASVRCWLHEIKVSENLTLWLVTTMDCAGTVLANLYKRRGDVETDIRDVKVTLCIEEMRAKSVSMLRKELATSMVAYNLVIQIRRLAAKASGVSPRRISFVGVWSAVRFVLLSPQHWTAQEWQNRFALALKMAGQRKLPNRAGRSYPRQALVRRNKSTSGGRRRRSS